MDAIDELRSLLWSATDFVVPWNFFHDRLAAAPEFIALGETAHDEKLMRALAAAVEKVVPAKLSARYSGKKARLASAMSIHIEERGMWHGACSYGRTRGVWFFFSEADIGLVGLSKDRGSAKVDLVRFSLVEVPAGTGFAAGPRGRA